MPILIDTSIAVDLRDGHELVRARLLAKGEQPVLSLVTVIELEGGIYARSGLASARRIGVDRLLRSFPVLGLDQSVVERYGTVLEMLGFSRARVLDRLIAATALVHDLTLITTNGPDFRDIPGLKLEVWPAPAQ